MKFKEILFFFLELVQIVAIALIIVLPIRYFIFQPFIVKGASMEPNFSDGDYLIIDELSYRLREPKRGEVIVFHYPKQPDQRFIKRIIGLPNEEVKLKDDKITITDNEGNTIVVNELEYLPGMILLPSQTVTLGKDEYFVLGDNRRNSLDSRKWGSLNRDEIIGKVLIRAWPPTAMAMIPVPEY